MNKGSTKLLVIVALIAVLCCSWYMLIDATTKENAEYEQQITIAREKLSAGLYQVALEHFEQAKTMRDSIELRDEMAEVYKTYGTPSNYESFCNQIKTDYPTEPVAYERLASFYCENKEYDLFYNIKKSSEKRGVKSDKIEELAKPLEYAYRLADVNAVELGSSSVGYTMALREKGFWGFLSDKGRTAVSFSYVTVSPFANNVFYAETKNGDYGLFDSSEKMISRVTDERIIEDCTILNEGKMAVKYDGKYHYCNESFNELFGAYDDASVFVGGVAAVKKEDKWSIIDEKGKEITGFIYEEIKLDDVDVAFRNGCAFAKKNGKYILIDQKGNQIGNATWEDVDAFSNDMLAAVMNNGKWGFVDATGKEVVPCQYEKANSFYNGMAAVQINEKWGFISSSDFELKIDAVFAEVRDFSKQGSVYVKEKDKWKLLQIYRLG